MPSESLAALRKALTLSPPAVRRRQLDRLEALIRSLRPGQTMAEEEVYLRVTGFSPAHSLPDRLEATTLKPLLCTLLEAASAAAPVPAEQAGEPVFRLPEACARAGVGRRTLLRWRRRGLPARYYTFADGRKALGIRRSDLEQALGGGRPPRPHRLTEQERSEALALARRLACRPGATPTSVARSVAERLGRAPGTIRRLIEQHDRDFPEEAIFPGRSGPLSEAHRRAIVAQYRAGTPVSVLAARYGRSKATIYRIVNEVRAAELRKVTLVYVSEAAFEEPNAEARVLGADSEAAMERAWAAPAVSLPEQSPLTAAQERALFRARSYCLHRAAAVRSAIAGARYVHSRLLEEAELWLRKATEIEGALLRLYGPLADAVARQHVRPGGPPAEALTQQARSRLKELLGTFDYTARTRFAAYARLALLKWFARGVESAPTPTV